MMSSITIMVQIMVLIFFAAISSTSMLFSLVADGASPPPASLVASHIFVNPFPTFLDL
jgi:hypothetical protein